MPDFKAMIKDFDEKETQRPTEAQKGKENPGKSVETKRKEVSAQNQPKAQQPKQGSFKQAINDIRKADEGTKVPPHGFEIGPDGTYVPKEYSDSDMKKAYDAAMEHIKKGGNAMEFRDQHPEYNADAIMAAFDDYSKSPKTNGEPENEEVDVPYHEGIKGKIVGRKDGVATVEYTTQNGITRRDQFHEDEFKSDGDKSLETIDNRGEGANPNFNREKFGKYFNPDGTLKKGMEDQYFAATRGRDDSGYNETARAELARREAEAAAPKGPGLTDAWKNEVVTPKNKQSFLDENGFNKDFYWDGYDLVDRKTDENVYSLPREGAQASFLQERMGFKSNGNGNATGKDYGGLDEEHNRLFEEYMSIDKEYRDADAKLDEQVRNGQINTDQWWDEKSKIYDHYTDLKKNKKAEMDSVYAKIKAIDDERERKIREAKEKKEADALTAKRNQVRAELERRNGRKYSDDEWATIVELASQIR